MNALTDHEIKKIEIELLKKIDEICEIHQLKYFLAFGSLLGAIRHGGFIPWDDDVDVWMPRCDYEKFIEICKQDESLHPYSIMHYSNNKNYCMGMARFYDESTIVKEEHVRECGLGIFVDVYPLDGCGNTPKEALNIFKKNKRDRFWAGIAAPSKFEKSNSGLIKSVCKWFFYKIANIMKISRILKRMDERSKKYDYKKYKYVSTTVWAIYRKKKPLNSWTGTSNIEDVFERDWFSETKKVKFENIYVNVPWKYDLILKQRYGDYMYPPPQSEQIGHHGYTAFRK